MYRAAAFLIGICLSCVSAAETKEQDARLVGDWFGSAKNEDGVFKTWRAQRFANGQYKTYFHFTSAERADQYSNYDEGTWYTDSGIIYMYAPWMDTPVSYQYGLESDGCAVFYMIDSPTHADVEVGYNFSECKKSLSLSHLQSH